MYCLFLRLHFKSTLKLKSLYWKKYKYYFKNLTDSEWIKDVSAHQKLSEEFITTFKQKVHWKNISFNQNLSQRFIDANINYIDLLAIKLRKRFLSTAELKDTIITWT